MARVTMGPISRGVSAVNSGRRQIGVPAGWDHAVKATTVRLAPGRTAYAILEYHDAIISSCPKADRATGDAPRWPRRRCGRRLLSERAFLDRCRRLCPRSAIVTQRDWRSRG